MALTLAGSCVIAFGGVYPWAWGTVVVSAIAAVCWRLTIALRAQEELPASPLLFPLLAYGSWVALQWFAGWSLDRAATLTDLLQLSGAAALFLLALDGSREEALCKRLPRWVGYFAAALALEALLQYYSPWRGYIYGFHDASYANPLGPFVNRDHFCGCMELLLPLAATAAFRPVARGRPEFATWLIRGIVPMLAAGTIVISQSRGGALSLVWEVVALAWLRPWQGRSGPQRRWSLPAALITLSVPMAFWRWQDVFARMQSLFSRHSIAGPLTRPAVWAATWHMFLFRPWVGIGSGAFARLYPAFLTADTAQIFQYAHNDFLQSLAETGVIGAACMLCFLGLFLASLPAIRSTGSATRRIRLGAWIGCTGLLVHTSVDFQFHIPANAYVFFVFAALAVGSSRRPPAASDQLGATHLNATLPPRPDPAPRN